MRDLLKYLKNYKLQCVMAPLFKMLEALFELFVPLVMAAIIDSGIAGNDLKLVLRLGLVLVGLAAIGLICSVSAQFFSAKAATSFGRELRHDLFAKIQSLSYCDMDRLGTTSMITRLTSDTNQVQNGVNMVLRLFLRSPFIVFGAMIMAFTIDVKSALIFVVTIPALTIVVVGITTITLPMFRKIQAQLDTVLGKTRENLNGVRVIRAFNREDEELEEFIECSDRLSDMQIVTGKISSLMNPLTLVIVNVATIILIWTGAIRVDNGIITQGQVVALVNYMSQILVELIKLANLIVTITKSIACANRISMVLAEEASVNSENGIKYTDNVDVCFEHVGLKYPEASEEALTDICADIKQGMTVGIIGSTGSGKSSLVNLLPRFFDITSGELLIGGVPIDKYDLTYLRSLIGMVPQKAVLFNGTIRENIKWGKEDATDEEVWEALRIAQAKEFVEAKEEGLDLMVSPGGKNLSGGQRQRLTLARAIVRKPKILILDDSASALDYMTDRKLREEIAKLENMTVFIVSQRTASLRNADCIYVLEDGQIVGHGTHDELLENCEVYEEIYDSQYSGEVQDE